jgi:hypothetical protein
MCMVAARPIATLPARHGQGRTSIKLIIDLLIPELRLSHDPIDRFSEQAAVEAAHMHHSKALLLQHAGHLAGRLDLPKIRLQIEFEQSLDRALAA